MGRSHCAALHSAGLPADLADLGLLAGFAVLPLLALLGAVLVSRLLVAWIVFVGCGLAAAVCRVAVRGARSRPEPVTSGDRQPGMITEVPVGARNRVMASDQRLRRQSTSQSPLASRPIGFQNLAYAC